LRGKEEKMQRRILGKKGFTLIELMTVVIIVGILAAVAVPLYRAQVKKAIASEGAALVGSVRTAERVYYAEHNSYTDDADELTLETFDNKYFDWGDVTITLTGSGTGFSAEAAGRADSAADGITVTINETGDITYDGL